MRFSLLFITTCLLISCTSPTAAPTPAPPTPIILPLTLYILDDASGQLSSQRTEQELRTLYTEVNEIWSPANITIELQTVERLELPSDSFEPLMSGDFDAFFTSAEIQPLLTNSQAYLTGFYTSQLFANGIAPSGGRAFFVSDTPTVPAERVTAHEIGHMLGLHHELVNAEHLMYSGTAGTILTEEEITVARYVAQGLISRVR